ncbi:MAG: hypothetical protein ACOZBW_01635, partial [Thermodesulfobacteriota bacterium]
IRRHSILLVRGCPDYRFSYKGRANSVPICGIGERHGTISETNCCNNLIKALKRAPGTGQRKKIRPGRGVLKIFTPCKKEEQGCQRRKKGIRNVPSEMMNTCSRDPFWGRCQARKLHNTPGAGIILQDSKVISVIDNIFYSRRENQMVNGDSCKTTNTILMLMVFFCLFFTDVVVGENTQKAIQFPEINIVKSTSRFFSSTDKPDQVTISVIGKDSTGYTYSLMIENPEGETIYELKGPLGDVICDLPYDVKDFIKRIEDFIQSEFLGISINEKSSALPPYSAIKDEIPISEKNYNRIKELNLPTIELTPDYESWRTIVFDPANQKVVIIIEGSI